jgi:tellurite methyltransferase
VKRILLPPPSAAEIAILDVRDEAAFAAGHLAGSGHVPLAELESRRAELPPREAAVIVVAADPDAARAGAAELERMGYLDVGYVDAEVAALPGGGDDRHPAARLWRPAPFLEAVLDRLPRGRAIDLAAGSGREAVFLAMHGFEVEAWDRAPEALERARNLAARHGVRITTTVCNLEWGTPPIEPERYQVVTCFRFLHRPLFPVIERALAPGGCLVYETYRVGQERFGRPRSPKFLLTPGELASSVPGLRVEHEEERSPEAGPLTSRLLARKPLPGDPS